MSSSTLDHDDAETGVPGQWFRTEAAEVMDALRNRVSAVLSDLGGFNRPADLQHSLMLDKTLGRQIFKLACTAELLGSGTVVPSRTSIGRFLDAARERGIENEKLVEVWNAYEQFEKLVETHAGDRVTFNSMVAAVSGVDDEWLATDLQHRRNAFRAMSHTIGMQAKTRLQLSVLNEIENGSAYSVVMVSGFIGLRVLRALPSILIDGMAVRSLNGDSEMSCMPLHLSDSLDGFLLDSYSSKPLPSLRLNEQHNSLGKCREVLIDHPKIGNTGASNLLFGTIYPRVLADSDPLRLHVTMSRPTEVLLFDVLAAPGFSGNVKPTSRAVLGFSYNDNFGERMTPLEGRFDAEFLGKGPAALVTPQVPRYGDLLKEVGSKMNWNLQEYSAYRIRVEFPLYHSTFTMNWGSPSPQPEGTQFRSTNLRQ